MTTGPVLEYTWIVIVSLTTLFVIVKLAMMKSLDVSQNLPSLFFFSLQNVNQHKIETINKRTTKKYLRWSNKVNTLFYITAIGIILIYIFFKYTVH